MSALIFDCDGVLADTERLGHLPAFNRTLREFGLPVQWTEEEYGVALGIGGGKERMAALLTPELVAEAGLPADPEGQAAEVAKWHRRKTELYVAAGAGGRAAAASRASGASWTRRGPRAGSWPSVRPPLNPRSGPSSSTRSVPRLPADFLVLAGDVVPRKKPAPDIYLLALERLGIEPGEAVVIEDSRNGLLASVAAGLATVVTVNGYTRDEVFDEAALVVSSLGDPDDDPVEILASRSAARPIGWVRLTDLQTCLG